MYLQEILSAFNYQIVDGAEYMWPCWPGCRFLNLSSEHADVNVVFNIDSREIYEATVCVKGSPTVGPYRWLNPTTVDVLKYESKERGIDNSIAWDDVKWIDLDLEEDFFEKAIAMFNGEEFDERIQMPLDIDDETFNLLAREAHRRDITFNALCMEAISDFMDKVSRGEITKETIPGFTERYI